MAIEKLGLRTAKRFGTRYGPTPKQKIAAIEAESRASHECPYCGKRKASRVSVGIWHCSKCGAKFAGKAYSVSKRITFEKQAAEEAFVLRTREAEEVEG